MNLEELRKCFDNGDLGQYFEMVKPLFKPSIALDIEVVDEDDVEIGQSRLGGRPDLPPEIEWPTETNIEEILGPKPHMFAIQKRELVSVTRSLSFIAQINLEEAARFDTGGLLPKSGILYFFYSAEQTACGDTIEDKNKFKVLYWNNDFNTLKRTEFPEDLPPESCFSPCSVKMKAAFSPPPYHHELLLRYFTPEERIKYDDYVKSYESDNRLLGYPGEIQGSMEYSCEMLTNGINIDDSDACDEPEARQLEKNLGNWQILLQLGSINGTEMIWSDAGRLYYWIRKDDLLKGNFDRSWFAIQCY